MLVNLAERYHWTPEQVLAMDPDFLDELTVRLAAEADAERAKERRRTRRGRRQATQQRMGPKWQVQDVGIEEIE